MSLPRKLDPTALALRLIRDHRREDGGAGTAMSDLWATYAGVRTLTWIDRLQGRTEREPTIEALRSRQNRDGAFSWQRGLPSDVWATFYACEALLDLGAEIDDLGALQAWLTRTQNCDGGFGMTPGQNSCVWATYYASRLFPGALSATVPHPDQLASWLRRLQNADGGLTWSPGHETSDVRATYYAVHSSSAAGLAPHDLWDTTRLRDWLESMQTVGGGFRFGPDASACLWATFRATRTFQTLGWGFAGKERCADWIRGRLHAEGFSRWDDYRPTDVWANFSGVGALIALGAPLEYREANVVESSILNCFIEGGEGLTYRSPTRASDALTTSALLIGGTLANALSENVTADLAGWLKAAHMPWEGGIMYMPARGAEIRCSLWALVALDMVGQSLPEAHRLVRWIAEMQNPDGGFGYWLGRGSDVSSSVAAAAILRHLKCNLNEIIDVSRLHQFVFTCMTDSGIAAVPGGAPSASAVAHASGLFWMTGCHDKARGLVDTLQTFASLAGYREGPTVPPSLLATYQCCLAFDRIGSTAPFAGLSRFLAKLVSQQNLVSWTPLGQQGQQDPLAASLYLLLRRKCEDSSFSLPELILSA